MGHEQGSRHDLIAAAVVAARRAAAAILDVYGGDIAIEHKDDRTPLTEADRRSSAIIEETLSSTALPLLGEEGRHTAYEERREWQRFWLVDPLDGTKEFIKRNGEFTVNIALIEDGFTMGGVVLVPVTGTLYFAAAGTGAFRTDVTADHAAAPTAWDALVSSATRLPLEPAARPFTAVASRSHMTPETAAFIDELKQAHDRVDIVSRGSSLKLCMIAEGAADVYPRFAPTMEWDTAAGHSVVKESGGNVFETSANTELRYNKRELLNPWFIARRPYETSRRR